MQLPALSLEEKQLISTLNWFRSRYALYQGLDPDRPATSEAIEQFGDDWIGIFKKDWQGAFHSLLEKGLLAFENGQYNFSDYGTLIKETLEEDTPFYKFEYDNFYTAAKNSRAHHYFCKRVYGRDLVQHGLINMDELLILEEHLQALSPLKVLDLGCGIGEITAYLAKKFPQTHFTGMDISDKAVQLANRKFSDLTNLTFFTGNFNQLEKISEKFDAILALDTFYYCSNLEKSINDLKELTTNPGTLFAYYSQWIMDDSYKMYLQPDLTGLARVLKDQSLSYRALDLTTSGIQHWKDKEKVLLEMKEDFEAENKLPLWNYRFREATRYANWGDDKYSRYFYQVRFN